MTLYLLFVEDIEEGAVEAEEDPAYECLPSAFMKHKLRLHTICFLLWDHLYMWCILAFD